MLLGDQKYVQVRAERAAHIGQEKIQRVERDRVEAEAQRLKPGRGFSWY